MYETKTITKRTIFVAECECGNRFEKDKDPPRSRLCGCGKWVDFKAVTYTGPDEFDDQ